MAAGRERHSTAYPGVFYYDDSKNGKVYYIRYRRGGRDSKVYEEKIGSRGISPKIAAGIREERIKGIEKTNEEKREEIKKDETTLKELYKLYMSSLSKTRGRKTDEINFNHLSKIHSYSIDKITTKIVDEIRYEKEKTLKPQTVKHILNMLTRTINFGVKKGYIPQPDTQKFRVDKPKFDNTKTEVMTEKQLNDYLKALDKEEDQNSAAFLRLALFTGMRRGALIGLKWADIDFEAGLITLTAEHAKNDKTAHIAVSEEALAVLKALPRSSEFVFPGKCGGQRENFRRMARRVKEKAGLPADFRPLHGLRHNFASRLASSGQVDMYTLQKLLTHESPEMTQRYAHLSDEAMRRAAAVVSGVMLPREGKNDEVDNRNKKH